MSRNMSTWSRNARKLGQTAVYQPLHAQEKKGGKLVPTASFTINGEKFKVLLEGDSRILGLLARRIRNKSETIGIRIVQTSEKS